MLRQTATPEPEGEEDRIIWTGKKKKIAQRRLWCNFSDGMNTKPHTHGQQLLHKSSLGA